MTDENALHAPLDEYARQFEALERDALALTEGLDDDQFNWSPAPGKWSIAECLIHLNVVARGYEEKLAEGIARARERGSARREPVRYSFLERWLIRSMEPPPGFRMPAPKSFRPAAASERHARDATVDEFVAHKRRFIELLHDADDLDVGRAKMTSPESRLVRLRLGAAFAFLASHERRHLWQARQIRESAEFPER